jgi:hypothetical protein
MAFLPPAVSRRIPRLFQRATQPPYLRAGDLWSHSDGSGVDYYDGSVLKSLFGGSASGPAFSVAAYHYGSATWADAIRAAYAACRAAGGGRVLLPPGQTLNLDQAGHPQVLTHLHDGNGAWSAPTIGRIVLDLNGCTVQLGANTLRLVDAEHTTPFDWVRNLEICNGRIDAGQAQGSAGNHVVFGNLINGFLGRMNYENIYLHDLEGFNAYTNTGAGQQVMWIALCPAGVLNDANPILMRDITVEDCRFKGGTCGLFVCGTVATGQTVPVQPTDYYDITVQRLYVQRFFHDTGVIPTAFTTGGAQVGGYALVKDSTFRDWFSKGAGDAGFEIDNAHNVLFDHCVIEDAYNSEYLVSSFAARDADQGAQDVTYRSCVARHSGGGVPTQLGGFLAYTIYGHRLGTVKYVDCRYESNAIPLPSGTGIDALAFKQFAGTLTANANSGDTTIQLANAFWLVVGYEVQVGANTSGEWVTVTGITDSTHATVTALASNHLSGANVTQPLPIERLEVDGLEAHVTGWTYSNAAAARYQSLYATIQQCALRLRRVRTRISGTTAGGAGALDYYAGQISGRNVALDVDGLEAKADITYGGTQGSYRMLILGIVDAAKPSSIRGVLRRLRPRPGTGFPAANQTGLYLMDRNNLVIDPGLLVVEDSDFGDLALGAKEVTWQAAGENQLPVRLAESNRPRSHTTWPQTFRQREDFMDGAAATSLSIGEGGWFSTDTNAGGSTTRTVIAGHPGVQRLDSGATAGNVRQIAANNLASLGVSDVFDLYAWFQINQTDSLARIGLAAAWNAAQPTSGIYLEKLDTGVAPIGTDWYFVTRNAGTQTATDSAVAVVTGWHQLRIRQFKDKGTLTVGFTLDSGAEVLQTTNLPAGGALVRGAHVGNGANASSRTLDLDLIDFLVPNLVR